MSMQPNQHGPIARSTAEQSRLRLQTIVRLRWFAVAGQLSALLLCHFVLGFKVPLGYCLALVALSAWLNVYLRLKVTRRHPFGDKRATALLVYDLLQLSALLYLTGGITNPFTVLLVAPVTVSAATLPLASTLILGAISIIVTGLLVFVHMPLPWSLTPDADFPAPQFPAMYRFGLFASVVACMIFLGIYVRRLARESQQMSDALTATELILAREQKLHALDGLAAAAAHELGTPLATIALVSKELKKESESASNRSTVATNISEDLELLHTQAQRCREILQNLTRAPTERDPVFESISIRQLVDEACEPHRHGHIKLKVIAATDSADQLAAPIGERSPGIIYGLRNLIENAVDYATRQVVVEASWDRSSVVVMISDDGPGFAPEVRERIGEPYVTTRATSSSGTERSGLGLGFFIAKTLLERSGAALEFDNRKAPENGAIVRINWPRTQFESATAAWR